MLTFFITPSLHRFTRKEVYIKRRLKMAEATGAGKNRLVEVNDLVNEVYTRAFHFFESRPEAAENLLPWIYQIADDVLEAQLKEHAFEKEHVQSLDSVVAAEIRQMKESFTADADGDLVMMEELDDPSYHSRYYQAGEIIEKSLDEETLRKIESLDEGQIHKIVCEALAAQLSLKRSVFDLYWLEGFDEEEIALIKKISVEEVRSILCEIKNIIAEKLKQEVEANHSETDGLGQGPQKVADMPQR